LKPHVGLYVERLNELVRHPDPTVALPALREALDRLLGKPVAMVEQDIRHMDVGQVIRDMWLQVVQQKPEPTTIDAHAPSAGEANHTATTSDVAAATATIAPPSHDGADVTNEW
jgi:hypothetical protein